MIQGFQDITPISHSVELSFSLSNQDAIFFVCIHSFPNKLRIKKQKKFEKKFIFNSIMKSQTTNE